MRHITRGRVHAHQVRQRLRWLDQLYRSAFLELAGEACDEKVSPARYVNGGELVFAHDAAAASIADVERDCAVVRPSAGHLIFFDARRYPHYVRPLTQASDMRVVAVMNYYTESCPESNRPRELNQHLYGDDV